MAFEHERVPLCMVDQLPGILGIPNIDNDIGIAILFESYTDCIVVLSVCVGSSWGVSCVVAHGCGGTFN